jgi:hypothetical protein
VAKAAKFQTFDKDLQLATAGIMPDQIRPELARYARKSVAEVIANKQASSSYEKYVSGRRGAEEETVSDPLVIYYEFSYWQEIIAFALDFLKRRSPVLTARYQNAHQVMLGSQFVSADIDIAPDEEVTIVNTRAYSRKIEVGFMRMSVDRGVYQDARKAVMGKYGQVVDVRFQMITIPNGYVLKGRFRRGFRQYARTGLKKDTAAGQPMTYPSILMRMR